VLIGMQFSEIPDCVPADHAPSCSSATAQFGGTMPQGGTPPLVPMWPQSGKRESNMNPFPFFPFDPHWGDGLPMMEYETFCTLLRLAWVSPRPAYLPADPAVLNTMLKPYQMSGTAAPVSPRLLAYFTRHPRTGLLYFPPQMRALERLVGGENMYSLLWEGSE
jgi:hypothetical protein